MSEKSNVKQNILAAALALFSAKGYDGVSVNELVSAVGVTKPTLYYHFGSKEGLIDAVCKENYAQLNSAMCGCISHIADQNGHQEDIAKKLTNIAATYLSFANKNEMFYRLALANQYMPLSSPIYPIAHKYHFEQYEILSQIFKNVQLAWSFVGTINAHVGLAWNGGAEIKLDESAAQELVHQFMHGFMRNSFEQNHFEYNRPISRY